MVKDVIDTYFFFPLTPRRPKLGIILTRIKHSLYLVTRIQSLILRGVNRMISATASSKTLGTSPDGVKQRRIIAHRQQRHVGLRVAMKANYLRMLLLLSSEET